MNFTLKPPRSPKPAEPPSPEQSQMEADSSVMRAFIAALAGGDIPRQYNMVCWTYYAALVGLVDAGAMTKEQIDAELEKMRKSVVESIDAMHAAKAAAVAQVKKQMEGLQAMLEMTTATKQ